MKNNLLLVLLLCTVDSFAQSAITWNSASDVAASSFGNRHPRIVLDADGNPLVLFESSDGKAQFTRWNGSAFTVPMPQNPSNMPAMTASFAGPDIASNGDTVYIVFKDTPEDINHHIFIVRSFDGGVTFSMPYQVEFNTDSMSRFPTVAVDGNGHPIVAYMKFNSDYSNAHWVVTRSTDYGATFLPDAPASGYGGELVCDCCPGSIVATGNEVAVLYRANLGNLRDTWAAFSTNGGTNFPTGINIDQHNWMLMSCPGSGPDGIIIADTLHSIFMNGASGNNMVYENQTGFTNPVASTAPAITGTFAGLTQQNFPRIANYNSAVAKVWKQVASGTTELALSFTNNIAQGFPASYEIVATGNITNTDVAVYDGAVHIVWEDANSGTVKYRKGTFGASGVLTVQPIQTDTAGCATLCTSDVDAVVIGGTGPFTYSWNNGVTDDNLDDVCSGVYAVIVTDATGATAVGYVTVVSLAGPEATVASTSPACGFDGGAVDIDVTGGEAPFTFVWSNGTTLEDLVNVMEGSYVLTVTDDNGCSVVDTVTVAGSMLFNLMAVISNPTCAQSDGFIMLDVSGATPPYTFLWSTGATTENLTGVPAGAYSLTATDAVGCTALYSETLAADNAPTACFSTTGPLCSCTAPHTVLFEDCSAGSGLSYQWSLIGAVPITSSSADVTAVYNSAGSFDVVLVVTSTNGCTDTLVYDNYVNIGSPTLDVTASADTLDFGGTLVLQGSSATSYAWSATPATNVTFSNTNLQNTNATFSQPGTYAVCLSATFAAACNGCNMVDTCLTIVVLDTVSSVRNTSAPRDCAVRYTSLFNGNIQFNVPANGTLAIYDQLGRTVRSIDKVLAGSFTLTNLPPGMLMYQFIDSNGNVCASKFVVTR